MNYQVFARKYRPQDFDSVVGQEHITQTLKNAIEQDRLAQAYLFVGPRGTGKTSTARILAKALNCINGPTIHPCGVCDMCREIAAGTSLNVLEFDAASNTQVDKIREMIIDNVRYAPTSGKYKLYIVDEVHMLSTSSFNALLKTLEEPPAHVKFVFATTDVQKVPSTIVSRCQRFDLRRIPAHLIAQHLQFIAGQEEIALEEAAAEAIAKGADGGLRDAESMLDQLVAFCGSTINEADVLKIFGFTARETVSKLCGRILAGSSPEALAVVHEQSEAGKDLSRLMGDLISHLRDLLIAKADPDGLKDELGANALAVLKSQAESIAMERLLELIEQFAAAEARMKWAPNKKLHFEIAIIKAIQTLGQTTLTEILHALAEMRGGGAPVSGPSHAARASAVPVSAVVPAPLEEPRKSMREMVAKNLAERDRIIPAVAAAPKPAVVAAPTSIVAETAPIFEASAVALDPAELWRSLLIEVRKTRPLISSWVESGVLLSIEGDAALIGFSEGQTLAMESVMRPNNRKFLEDTLAEITGRAVIIGCEIRKGLVVERIALPVVEPEAAPDPMAEFKNDPLIRKALEIFKAEISEVTSPTGA